MRLQVFFLLSLAFDSSLAAVSRYDRQAISQARRASVSAPPEKNGGHRGLSYNDATLTQQFSLRGQQSKVSWAYNWASVPYYPGAHNSTNTLNPVLEFVPMLWNAADDLTKIWSDNVKTAVANYGTKHLLSFDAPDGCDYNQACMSVPEAVTAYKKYITPWAGYGLKLGSPAVDNSNDTDKGLDWLENFVTSCDGCAIDFLAIHWYGDPQDSEIFKAYLSGAYKSLGSKYPIWITEFGIKGGTDQDAMTFLKDVLPWLDEQPYIERYAYFMDKAGILLDTDGTCLTDAGTYYNSG